MLVSDELIDVLLIFCWLVGLGLLVGFTLNNLYFLPLLSKVVSEKVNIHLILSHPQPSSLLFSSMMIFYHDGQLSNILLH